MEKTRPPSGTACLRFQSAKSRPATAAGASEPSALARFVMRNMLASCSSAVRTLGCFLASAASSAGGSDSSLAAFSLRYSAAEWRMRFLMMAI